MTEIENVIRFANISHAYGSKTVLSQIDLSFKKLTTTAILGKSGSGKSTLLQLINGLIRPTHGDLFLFGEKIEYRHITALRRKIGYVVQQVGLFPHMTIYDNISLLGRVSHAPRPHMHARIDTLLDMVQLPKAYLKKYPHELSGGEQQRAGLCRAMLLEPPVLLLDEPFASLDIGTKRNIYDHLIQIQISEPRTVVLVTHDWEEAEILADCFVWLENGEVKDNGFKDELLRIKSSYSATL